jgi:hypothetical protein
MGSQEQHNNSGTTTGANSGIKSTDQKTQKSNQMKLAKTILKAVWPIVYNQLMYLAKLTTTPWDDFAVESANKTLTLWLEGDYDAEEEEES